MLYKMSKHKMNFNDAKKFCKDERFKFKDEQHTVLAMPRTEKDISDIKDMFDCKYCAHW